jgi:hypothetical protein
LHTRFRLHFTTISSSWLNLGEHFLTEITRKRIRHGVFKSVTDLEIAIYYYFAEHNDHAKPFVWNAKAADILTSPWSAEWKQALASEHQSIKEKEVLLCLRTKKSKKWIYV